MSADHISTQRPTAYYEAYSMVLSPIFGAQRLSVYLLSFTMFPLIFSGCMIDFNEFDPYTKPGAYGGEPVEVDMNPIVDMDPMVDMDPIVDMDIAPPPPPDLDGDGISDEMDNCLEIENPDQLDGDMDGQGDLCDDDDMDQILDYRADGMGGSIVNDNCLNIPNNDQKDSDWDGEGDACDNDIDGDGLNATEEEMLGTNPNQADTDLDGFFDGDDLCPTVPSRGLDQDADGLGDACDLDDDGDEVLDWIDACPYTSDDGQATPDEAAQGRGSACIGDFDADGITDLDDPCPLSPLIADRDHLSCQSRLIFKGYDADIYDLLIVDDYLWSASKGGLSRFTLDEQEDPDYTTERRYSVHQGLWSQSTQKLSELNVIGPNNLSIRGLWVVNGGRLSALRYEGVSGQYQAFEIDLSQYQVEQVYDVVGYEQGAIVATDYGIHSVKYNAITNIDLGPMSPKVSSLYHDKAANCIWFAVDSTLYQIDLVNPETAVSMTTLEEVTEIRKIKRLYREDGTHSLAILTDIDVIFYDVTTNAEAGTRVPIQAYELTDSPLGYYVATESGLLLTDQEWQESSQTSLKALQSAKTRVIAKKPQGGLIFGSMSDAESTNRPDGLGSVGGIKSGGGVWFNYEIEGQPCITDAHLTSTGDLWIATPNGLYLRSPDGVQTLVMEVPIFDIHHYAGALWVATNASVYRVDPADIANPVSYPLVSLTPPVTAIYGAGGSIWVGAQDGVAKSDWDETTGTLGPWTEFTALNEPYLPSGETIGFGYENNTIWIAVRGAQGGIARYGVDGFYDTVYSQQNSIIPSNEITGLSVNEQRIVVTTEIGVRIFKPVITANTDLVSLYARQGIPAEAGTGHILNVVDTGTRLWMVTKPTVDRPYGGLMTVDVDDPNNPLRTEFSERFYDEHMVDVLNSTLPDNAFGDRSRVNLTLLDGLYGGVLMSACGDENSPGSLGILDYSKSIEVNIEERGLIGSSQGVLVPSPRGHAMVTTAFGDIAKGEEEGVYGPGFTQTRDLYAPLADDEEWPANQEPINTIVSSDSLHLPIQDCKSYQRVGEATKRLTCVLKGSYLARQVMNNWIVDAEPLLNDNRLLIKDILLDPENPINTIWIATDRGLVNLRTNQSTVVTLENSDQKLPSDDIRALAWDPMLRKLFIGTTRGLVVLEASSPLPADLSQVEISPVSEATPILKGTIYSLYFSEDRTLWMSTAGGVASYKDDQLTVYRQGESIPVTPISSMVEVNGTMFFAHTGGISRLQDGSFTHYGIRDGVSKITGRLVADDRGTVWALSTEGAIGFPQVMAP